jgi:hypothetical protein
MLIGSQRGDTGTLGRFSGLILPTGLKQSICQCLTTNLRLGDDTSTTSISRSHESAGIALVEGKTLARPLYQSSGGAALENDLAS